MGTLRVNINQHHAKLRNVWPGVPVVYGQLTLSAGPSLTPLSGRSHLQSSAPQLRPGARPGQSHPAVQSPVIIVVCNCNCCHMVKRFLL